jgi:AraC-like DNA-binding protein
MEVERSVQEILFRRDWAKLAADLKYDAKALAAFWGMSSRTLQRQFHHELKISPQEMLNLIRDLESLLLVKNGVRKKEVVDLLGYKHPAHLSRRLMQTNRLLSQMRLGVE